MSSLAIAHAVLAKVSTAVLLGPVILPIDRKVGLAMGSFLLCACRWEEKGPSAVSVAHVVEYCV